MLNNTIHPITLTFKDRKLENEFLFDNDLKMARFNRIGIYLSALSWTLGIISGFSVYPEQFRVVALIGATIILPIFIIAVALTYYTKYWMYFQPMIGAVNFVVGVIAFLLTVYVDDYVLLAIFLLIFPLFAHFILRTRFKIALFITTLYTLFAILLVLLVNEYTASELYYAVVAATNGLLITNIGGYYLEYSNRDSFIKRRIIKQQQLELKEEQEKSERLLLNILPDEIAARLKLGNDEVIADHFQSITVLFADIVDFTKLFKDVSPQGIVSFLNELFVRFDDLVEKYGLEKIKTIGDAYMVAAGIPLALEGHATNMLNFSLDLLEATQLYNQESGRNIRLRIGINSGPAVAGIIGNKNSCTIYGGIQ